jgi:hypothetical protein
MVYDANGPTAAPGECGGSSGGPATESATTFATDAADACDADAAIRPARSNGAPRGLGRRLLLPLVAACAALFLAGAAARVNGGQAAATVGGGLRTAASSGGLNSGVLLLASSNAALGALLLAVAAVMNDGEDDGLDEGKTNRKADGSANDAEGGSEFPARQRKQKARRAIKARGKSFAPLGLGVCFPLLDPSSGSSEGSNDDVSSPSASGSDCSCSDDSDGRREEEKGEDTAASRATMAGPPAECLLCCECLSLARSFGNEWAHMHACCSGIAHISVHSPFSVCDVASCTCVGTLFYLLSGEHRPAREQFRRCAPRRTAPGTVARRPAHTRRRLCTSQWAAVVDFGGRSQVCKHFATAARLQKRQQQRRQRQ